MTLIYVLTYWLIVRGAEQLQLLYYKMRYPSDEALYAEMRHFIEERQKMNPGRSLRENIMRFRWQSWGIALLPAMVSGSFLHHFETHQYDGNFFQLLFAFLIMCLGQAFMYALTGASLLLLKKYQASSISELDNHLLPKSEKVEVKVS